MSHLPTITDTKSTDDGRRYVSYDLKDAAQIAAGQTTDALHRDMLLSLAIIPLADDPDPTNDLDFGPDPQDGIDWGNVDFPLDSGDFPSIRDIIAALSTSDVRLVRVIALNLDSLKHDDSTYRSDARIVDPVTSHPDLVDDADRVVISDWRGI